MLIFYLLIIMFEYSRLLDRVFLYIIFMNTHAVYTESTVHWILASGILCESFNVTLLLMECSQQVYDEFHSNPENQHDLWGMNRNGKIYTKTKDKNLKIFHSFDT